MSKNLEKFQVLSIVTKIITLTVGVIQSVIIIRILSVQEYGLVGLVLSIGAFIGIYQHLGLQEGIIREVSATKKKKQAAKVISTSLLMRLFITIPLAILLFLLAGIISVKVYNQPEITAILRFFSLILILQGIEGIFGAALAGLQKFKALFSAQIVSSLIALGLLTSFTYFMRVPGFFYAMALASLLMTSILLTLVAKNLGKNIAFPRREEFKKILNRVFEISFIIYLARILFTFWQRMGILILGFFVSAFELGLFNMALVFGTKLVILSHAISEVNLAVMTKKFSENYEDFIKTFKRNFVKVFSFVLFVSLSVIFFAREIIVYILGNKYLPALKIIPLIITAFFIYTVIDLTANSLFVPARKQRFRLYTFIITVIVSGIAIYLLIQTDSAPFAGAQIQDTNKSFGTALGLFAGILAGGLYLIGEARQRFKINVIAKKEILIVLALLPIIITNFFSAGLISKMIIYVLNTGLFALIIQKLGIINFKNLKTLVKS